VPGTEAIRQGELGGLGHQYGRCVYLPSEGKGWESRRRRHDAGGGEGWRKLEVRDTNGEPRGIMYMSMVIHTCGKEVIQRQS